MINKNNIEKFLDGDARNWETNPVWVVLTGEDFNPLKPFKKKGLLFHPVLIKNKRANELLGNIYLSGDSVELVTDVVEFVTGGLIYTRNEFDQKTELGWVKLDRPLYTDNGGSFTMIPNEKGYIYVEH